MKKYLYSALPFAFVLGVEASDGTFVDHLEIHAGEGEVVTIGSGCTIVTVPDTQEIHLSSIYEALDDFHKGNKEKLTQLMMHPKYGDDVMAIVNAANYQKIEEMKTLMVALKQKRDRDQAQKQPMSSIDEALYVADEIEKRTQKNERNERRLITLKILNQVFHEETGHWMDEFMVQILPNKSDSTIFCLSDDSHRLTIIDLMLLSACNGAFTIPRRAYPLFPDLFDTPEAIKFDLASTFAKYDMHEGIEVAIHNGWGIHSESLESMKRDARNEKNPAGKTSDLQASMLYFLIKSLNTHNSGTRVLDYLLNLRPELMYFTVKNSPLLSMAFSYGTIESINYLTERGFDPNTGFPAGFQPSSHDYIFPLMAASLRESMSSAHIDFFIAHNVNLFQHLSLINPTVFAIIKSSLKGSENCNGITEINALAVLAIRGMSYMFEELMKHKEFNVANSLQIVAGVKLKNQKRFPIWLSWWEQGNAGIPNQLVEMSILKFDEYRDDIDRFFELGDFSIWDLIDEAAGPQKNASSNSADSQQESQQNDNTTDITAEITAPKTPKKSTGKGKEEEDKFAIEKEFRQTSKQEVAGWLIEHDFQLTRKNVPGFLAVELLEALHIAVTKRDLPGVQKRIKQGGDAIGDILKLPLKDSNITLLDVVNFQLDDTSQEEPSKKGRKQKKAKRGKQLTNTKDPQLIEIKKALEAVMPQGNSNSQETNISENIGNSENEQKEDTKNEDLEQKEEKVNQSPAKLNETTPVVTEKEAPKPEAKEKVQTNKIGAKTNEIEVQGTREESETSEIKSPKYEKGISPVVVLPEKQQRRQERKKKKEEEKKRQEQRKALERQEKTNKVEKSEKVEEVEQTETGKTEKPEIIEKTQKPAEQKDQKIETISKSFQRNESMPQKQELSLSSLNFKDVNEGKRIKIKAIPLLEDIMGTKIDKEIQTTNLGVLPQSPNSKFNKLTQTPRAWQQRQIIRVNPPRLQFFHDETQTVSINPIPPKNKTLQSSSVVSLPPDLWEAREFVDQESYRIFEEELKKPNPDFTLTTGNGQNILHLYAKFGKISEIENLYEARPDIFKQLLNSSDMGEWTALHLAVKYGHGEIVRFLLQHGINNFIRQSARDFAYSCCRNMLEFFDE